MRLPHHLATAFSNHCVRRANRLIQRDKHSAAVKLLVRAVRAGNAAAAYRLGCGYLHGGYLPACQAEALRWLDLAARRGIVEAQTRLAALHLLGVAPVPEQGSTALNALFDVRAKCEPDYESALSWALRAAEAGCGEAQALAAYILTFGPGSMVDLESARELYTQSAMTGCPQGILGHALTEARHAATFQDWGVVRALLERIQDIPAAAYVLGLMHQDGRGTSRNLELAVSYFQRAAEKGHHGAQTSLGALLIEGISGRRDLIGGETWLRRAACAGNHDAARRLADLYLGSGLLPSNYPEAANWLRRAAQAGDGTAARSLAQLHLTGKDLPCDPKEALQWLLVSADAGNQMAKAEAGNLLLAGVPDPTAAKHLRQQWEKQAHEGDAAAAFNLALCCGRSLGIELDETAAAVWFRQSAERLPEAQYAYGRMLADGRGMQPDPAGARIWLARAADAGLADAQVALAEMLVNGRGGPASPPKARVLFEQAAASGHVGAMFALGAMYWGGHGVPADFCLARRWIGAASERGHARARAHMATIEATDASA
ncbi:tetratricopeptide repeat protein [Bradyrhizobium sp. STM 3557]|uniref:tetratricopeptide repeat protein n=1 Tax=Bradyrhizobium sp. STM 3557 TaxID=578920 RepID=UPI00388D264C